MNGEVFKSHAPLTGIPWWVYLPFFKTFETCDLSDQGTYRMKFKTIRGKVYVIACGWMK